MNNWVNMADLLKRVKEAREDFLMREFVDRSIIGPMLLDRLAADIRAGVDYAHQAGMQQVQAMTPSADDRYME